MGQAQSTVFRDGRRTGTICILIKSGIPEELGLIFVPKSLTNRIMDIVVDFFPNSETISNYSNLHSDFSSTSKHEIRIRLRGRSFPQLTDSERQQKMNSMYCSILTLLLSEGRIPLPYLHISRRLNQSLHCFKRDSQKLSAEVQSTQLSTFCVCAKGTQTICIVNAPSNLVKEAVESSAMYGDPDYSPEFTIVKDSNNTVVQQAVFYRSAWSAEKEGGTSVRRFFAELFYRLHQINFRFLTTANTGGGVDSLHFTQESTSQYCGDENIFANGNLLLHTQPTSSCPRYWMISLNRYDRLRVAFCSAFSAEDIQEIFVLLRDIVVKWGSCYHGVMEVSDYYGLPEITLSGSPWCPTETSEAVTSRSLLTHIFEDLSKMGHDLTCSFNLFRRRRESRNVFLFSTSGSVQPLACPRPPTVSFFGISLNSWDKLRLIRCPADVSSMLLQTVERFWSAGICQEII